MRYQTKADQMKRFGFPRLPCIAVEVVVCVGGETARGFTANSGDLMVTSPRDGGEPRIYAPIAFENLFEPVPE